MFFFPFDGVAGQIQSFAITSNFKISFLTILLGLFFLHDLNILNKSLCETIGVLGDPPTDFADFAREGGDVSLECVGVVRRERGDRFRGGVIICLGEDG